MSDINKYLNHYAEQETHYLASLMSSSDKSYATAVVIPCFNETIDFITRLSHHPQVEDVLIIVVLNQPDHIEDESQNQGLLDTLCTKPSTFRKEGNLYLCQWQGLNLLVVDRFVRERKIPRKQGVGLARKIGADIAVWLHQEKLTRSNLIYSTDADAHLPDNYFSLRYKTCESAGYIFAFQHIDHKNAISAATLLYEKAIKYYQQALTWAGSPYAYHTLGSTLAFTAQAYCKVRGFPKKAGGEDFYLVNKLAKVGAINQQTDTLIQLEPRASDRVPFGTGPAAQDILTKHANDEEYCYYDPEIFTHLHLWLSWAQTVDFDLIGKLDILSLQCNNNHAQLDNLHIPRDVKLRHTLVSMNIVDFLGHVKKQCRNQSAFLRHFHQWFDGFKTLKFVHHLQAHYYPPKPLEHCIQRSKEIFRDRQPPSMRS